MKQWRCSVCGYIHTGDQPPEFCPICGAPASSFEEVKVEAETTQPQAATTLPASAPSNRLLRIIFTEFPPFQLHPILVHFPNGLIPTSILFLILSWAIKIPCLESAAFYTLLTAIIVSPLVVATGIYNWRTRYQGLVTKVFLTKIIGGITLAVLGAVTVVWRAADPRVMTTSPGGYLILNLALLALAILLGHLGGKLAFAKHG